MSADQELSCPSAGTQLSAHREDAVSALTGHRQGAGRRRDPSLRWCLRGVFATLVDGGFTGSLRRVTGQDSLAPLGSAARHVVVDEESIEQAALQLVRS